MHVIGMGGGGVLIRKLWLLGIPDVTMKMPRVSLAGQDFSTGRPKRGSESIEQGGGGVW